MSVASQMISNYSEIRGRLRHPPNAVIDRGIDLHPNRIPLYPPIPTPPKVLECVVDNSKTCNVTIQELKAEPVTTHRLLKFPAIEKAVCAYFHITVNALNSRCRAKKLIYPRHICWYLARSYTGLSLPQIARRTGCPRIKSQQLTKRGLPRDHTTILHAKRKIQEMLLVDNQTIAIVRFLEYMLFRDHDNQSRSAMATVGERDMAQEQEQRLPKSEICELD